MLSEDRRREARIQLKVMLVVDGTDVSGRPFREEAITEDVSQHGACIRLRHPVSPGSQLQVWAVKFPFAVHATVNTVWASQTAGEQRVGVEFLDPAKNWILK